VLRYNLNEALQQPDLKVRELFFDESNNQLLILVKNLSAYYTMSMNNNTRIGVYQLETNYNNLEGIWAGSFKGDVGVRTFLFCSDYPPQVYKFTAIGSQIED